MKENKIPSSKKLKASLQHPLKNYQKEIRINFIYIIALMAGVDGIISGEELDYLASLCHCLDITEIDKDKIMESVRCHPEKLSDSLKSFTSDVKFTLIWGIITMIYADGLLASEERDRLNDIAQEVDIKPEQLDFIINLMKESLKRGTFSGLKEEFHKELTALKIPAEFILF
ncbi:MAG: hypothetical protein ABRQ37_11010 [Candidatus Eremiobacterota bacterium]